MHSTQNIEALTVAESVELPCRAAGHHASSTRVENRIDHCGQCCMVDLVVTVERRHNWDIDTFENHGGPPRDSCRQAAHFETSTTVLRYPPAIVAVDKPDHIPPGPCRRGPARAALPGPGRAGAPDQPGPRRHHRRPARRTDRLDAAQAAHRAVPARVPLAQVNPG